MKFYVIQTVECDSEGMWQIILHKHLYIVKQMAVEEAAHLGENTSVLELTQTDSWNAHQMKDFAPCPGC